MLAELKILMEDFQLAVWVDNDVFPVIFLAACDDGTIGKEAIQGETNW